MVCFWKNSINRKNNMRLEALIAGVSLYAEMEWERQRPPQHSDNVECSMAVIIDGCEEDGGLAKNIRFGGRLIFFDRELYNDWGILVPACGSLSSRRYVSITENGGTFSECRDRLKKRFDFEVNKLSEMVLKREQALIDAGE